MKNSFNVTHKNSAKAVAIFFIIVVAIVLIAGCGDSDLPTGGNNDPSAFPVYSIDSLVLRTMAIGTTDTLFNRDFIADLDSFKITFTIETNAENSFTNLDLFVADSTSGVLSYVFTQGQLNESYSYLCFSPYTVCTKHILAKLTVNGNGNVDKYLILKNFKVFKIN